MSRLFRSRRGSWWLTFTLVFLVGGFWSLASPPTAAPDELDHAVYASAVARGQLTGDAPSPHQLEVLARGRWKPSAYRTVDAPAIYADPNVDCFAFQPDASAACLHFEGSDRIVPVLTPVTWYPPVYYGFVGLVSRPFPPGPLALAIMRLAGVAVMAALLASAVASLRTGATFRLRLVGFLVGLTPMVLFLGASVNPSGPEIAAGLAVWASGIVLVRTVETDAAIDGRVVWRVGIAAVVLALARQDGPFWLFLILVTLAFLCGRGSLARLWRSARIRVWTAVLTMAAVAQVVWVQRIGTLTEEHSIFRLDNLSGAAALRQAIGRSSHWYHEMIGWFGWLDTPSPTLTVLLYTFVLGGLVLLAVAYGRTRWVVAAVFVLAVTAILPIALEYLSLQDIVAGRWQGRYALPFVVGAPLLAAFALERDDSAARISAGAFPFVALGALGVAHVVAFAQNLRRYTVGYNGKVLFMFNPDWSPPLGAGVVLLGFTVALGLMYAWLLALSGASGASERTPA